MGHRTTWAKLPEQSQKDLTAWLNHELSKTDKIRLARLYQEGRFEAWDCPVDGCDERVYQADPEDWADFQGTRQVDYMSYPGGDERFSDEFSLKMCDRHRCYQSQLKVAIR